MPILILVRGISGSGKSTFANMLKDTGLVDVVTENDAYRIKDGQYHYDPQDTPTVVRQCYQDTIAALEAGRNVAVANAFIRPEEMDIYLAYAKQHGIKVIRFIMDGYYGNVHDTPLSKLGWMRDNIRLSTIL